MPDPTPVHQRADVAWRLPQVSSTCARRRGGSWPLVLLVRCQTHGQSCESRDPASVVLEDLAEPALLLPLRRERLAAVARALSLSIVVLPIVVGALEEF